MRAVLRHRGFRLLLAGQTLSMFGSSALFLVLGIWVKELTGSNSAVGLLFMLMALPAIAAPLFGVAVDRFPRRQLMIVTDLVLAAAVLLLLLVDGRNDVWLIFAVAVVYSLGQPVFGSAKAGLIRGMLPEEQLAAANGAIESMRQALRIGAPLAGAGIYVAFGGGAVAAVDAVTFLASAGTLLAMRVPDIARSREPLRFVESFTEGIRHLWRTPDLRLLCGCIVAAICFIGVLEGAVFFALLDAIGKPPEWVGILSTIQGVGSIAGGIVSAWLIARAGELRVSGIGLAGLGVGFGLCAVLTVPSVLVGAVVIGITLTPFMVAFNTIVQKLTPLELQGRAFTAIEALFSAPMAIAMGLGAVLVAVVDIRVLYLSALVVLVALGGVLVRRRDPVTAPVAGPVADPA